MFGCKIINLENETRQHIYFYDNFEFAREM